MAIFSQAEEKLLALCFKYSIKMEVDFQRVADEYGYRSAQNARSRLDQIKNKLKKATDFKANGTEEEGAEESAASPAKKKGPRRKAAVPKGADLGKPDDGAEMNQGSSPPAATSPKGRKKPSGTPTRKPKGTAATAEMTATPGAGERVHVSPVTPEKAIGQKRKVEDVIKKEAEATDEGGEPAGKKAKVAGEAHIKTEVKEEDKEE